MKPYLIIAYFIAFVIISALGDALFDEGVKVWGHGLDFIGKGMLIFAFPIFKPEGWRKWIPFIIALVAWNVVLFDLVYNLSRGLDWNYIGSTSLWDQFFSKYPPAGMYIVKFLFLILAIQLPFRYFKD